MSEKYHMAKDINYLTTDMTSRLSIQNYKSQFVHLFNLRTPFLLVLETCNEKTDQYSFYQLSPDEHFCHILSKQEHIEFLNRPQHQHSFIEIMYVLSGDVTNHIENQTFTYHAGDCVVMNRNIRHIEDMVGNFQIVFLGFQEKFIDTLISEEKSTYRELPSVYRHYIQSPIIQMLQNTQKDNSQYQKIYFDCLPAVSLESIMDKMIPIFNTIFLELSEKNPGYLYIVKGYFQKFLSVLCDPALYNVTDISSTLSKQSFLLKKIRHIIESKHGKISRDELAEQLHYNEEYLNRIIKQSTGKTFSQYRQHIMLQETQKLLTNSNMSISKIIEYLGISNRSYFYQIFEKEFGIKPLEYRRINKAKHV